MAWAEKYRGRGESLKRSKLHLFKRLANTLAQEPEAREHLSLANTKAKVHEFLDQLERNELPELPCKPLKPHAMPVEEDDGSWVLFEEEE